MLTDREKIFLAQSKEFQQVLNTDSVLEELDRSRMDRPAELFSIMEMFRGTITIAGMPVQPITPAIWAFLWALENSYTDDLRKITESDTDLFLYLLKNGIRNLDCEVSELPAKTGGFCKRCGLDYVSAAAELLATVRLAFRPLEMLPRAAGVSARPAYDADWLSRVCSAAAFEANEKAVDIMFNMPLSACFYFYLNHLRKDDVKGLIHRATPGEIARDIVNRTEELGVIFVRENTKGQ